MYFARYKNQNGNLEEVSAAQYERARHGRDLLCGDPKCVAPMTYRAGQNGSRAIAAIGDSFTRAAHFATLPNRAHHQDCERKSLVVDKDSAAPAFHAAIASGRKIVINLNCDLGSGLNVRFRNEADARKSNTDYGRFMRENRDRYVTCSVNDGLAGFLARLKDIEGAGGKTALERVFVSHHLAMRPLDQVLIRHDETRLKSLYSEMFHSRDQIAVLPDRTVGFPRLFHFVPTEKTRQSPNPMHLTGNSITAATSHGGRNRLVLLSGLDVPYPPLRQRIAAEGEMLVLACPRVPAYAARLTAADYNRRRRHSIENEGTGFIFLDWPVVNAAQLASVPKNETVLKPGSSPFPRAGAGPIPATAQQILNF